jgi:hypothetical protein
MAESKEKKAEQLAKHDIEVRYYDDEGKKRGAIACNGSIEFAAGLIAAEMGTSDILSQEVGGAECVKIKLDGEWIKTDQLHNIYTKLRIGSTAACQEDADDGNGPEAPYGATYAVIRVCDGLYEKLSIDEKKRVIVYVAKYNHCSRSAALTFFGAQLHGPDGLAV